MQASQITSTSANLRRSRWSRSGGGKRRALAAPRTDAVGFELAAGSEDVAPARGAHRRRITGGKDDVGKRLDRRVGRAFERCARPGVERDQVDLGRDALEQPYQFARLG